MRRSRNIWCRVLFQAIFWLAGVAFFAGQFSGKFYRCACMPVHRSVGRVSSSPGKLHAVPALAGEDRESRLSMDKRYDLSAVFDLPAPVFRLVHYHGAAVGAVPLYSADLLFGVSILTPSRGPPASIPFL